MLSGRAPKSQSHGSSQEIAPHGLPHEEASELNLAGVTGSSCSLLNAVTRQNCSRYRVFDTNPRTYVAKWMILYLPNSL